MGSLLGNFLVSDLLSSILCSLSFASCENKFRFRNLGQPSFVVVTVVVLRGFVLFFLLLLDF